MRGVIAFLAMSSSLRAQPIISPVLNNPAIGMIHLKQKGAYKIYNLTGTLVKSGSTEANKPIDIKDLAIGIMC